MSDLIKKFIIIAGILILVIFIGLFLFTTIGFDNRKEVRAKAIEKNDPTVCEKVFVAPSMGLYNPLDMLMYLAFAVPDQTGDAKAGCYRAVADANKNMKACELAREVDVHRCYFLFIRDKIGSTEDPTVIMQVVTEVCSQVKSSTQDSCYSGAMHELASMFGSSALKPLIRLCDNVKDSSRRDSCIKYANSYE